MDETRTLSSSSPAKNPRLGLFVLLVAPLALAMILYRIDLFDPATIPEDSLSWASVSVSNHNAQILQVTERIGDGLLSGPEDIAYDAESRVIYTGCDDGWIKRITVTELAADAVVENWVHVGGRPLGLAFGPDKELVVAESYKGLLKVTREGMIKLLTDEADGLKFRLTDGVDVARNGVIYFTDASYKYNLNECELDFLEGRPYGRLMSYDPSTNMTQVLIRDLYFANGVAISPQEDFVIFCETTLRRCRKYYIQGEKKGLIDEFVDNLPGYPDNIRFDADNSQYWIALASGKTILWDALLRYPWLRKTTAMLGRFVKLPMSRKNSGIMAVNLDGEVIALYSDLGLTLVTTGFKIGNHLFYGSLIKPYIGRLDLTQYAA